MWGWAPLRSPDRLKGLASSTGACSVGRLSACGLSVGTCVSAGSGAAVRGTWTVSPAGASTDSSVLGSGCRRALPPLRSQQPLQCCTAGRRYRCECPGKALSAAHASFPLSISFSRARISPVSCSYSSASPPALREKKPSAGFSPARSAFRRFF